MPFKKETLEAYALSGSWMRRLADHTYVYCPETNQYFDCWGGHEGVFHRLICTGKGKYNIANAYRNSELGNPNKGHQDTAGIGEYMVNGISHQSANCFLYSARVMLTVKVMGYWASVMTYGPYGSRVKDWLLKVYKPCFQSNDIAYAMGNELTLFQKLQLFHMRLMLHHDEMDPNAVIMMESAIITRHFAPSVNPEVYEDLHLRYLKDKDAITQSDLGIEAMSTELNQLSREFQRKTTDWIGPEAYHSLTGLKAGDTVDIIDPSLIITLG